jgi:hypothetical protein
MLLFFFSSCHLFAQVGTIGNRVLASSLLDIYLGKDPVSPGAKAAFAEGLARLVAGT